MKRFASSALALALAGGVSNAMALSFDNGTTIHEGTGGGDLVLALVAGNDSLVWDLSGTIGGVNSDLTFNDIVALSNAGAVFSISNPAVSAFLTPARQAIAKWQVFGITNVGTIGDFVDTGDVPTAVGFALTVDGPTQPIDGGNLRFQVTENAQWLSNNVVAGIADNGVLETVANTPHAFYSPGAHGEMIAFNDATADGVDISIAFYTLLQDPSRPNEPPLNEVISNPDAFGSFKMSALVTELGSWRLAADGTLSFTSVNPIPIPAAAWMLGSGVLALAGIARRRRA